ncbi:2-oxoacid:acceptor oxidoreductase subunit alpha [Paraburkholderia dinghuensis]|uniref:2-oxoacid:acceptor oxidoreductase subunit alpha n=1 Tax=Paraburkholderia dinghuensis TaxID=2305225 RepID=A0A3N6PSE9_9BURK|nr:2-oxoacid:acceptor oxidoreductase subunit alpha [Paraburkholderia dinghuensis]RQH04890.1 2-oxoacid:acceptor oxidoreductase subunit alpha [Paraburkholderia dinghuensis]
MEKTSIAIAIAGSGGSGVITTGSLLLEAAGRAGWYGQMTRSVGAQIRGGEAVAMLHLATRPVRGVADGFDLLVALDWQNLARYAAEMPLGPGSLLVGDSELGDAPAELRASGAALAGVRFRELAQTVPGGRPNMVAFGLVAEIIGLPIEVLHAVIERAIAVKGTRALEASLHAMQSGRAAAAALPVLTLPPRPAACSSSRWRISGNQATGLGAVRGGVRFVAAYPITPATEVLEWMAPALEQIGGQLVQVEDELAAINQIIGASYGGVPAMTATSGPGLSLMTESIGLSVASETPVVVVDVMRGGPSTGIPAKSEQADLNIALYGLHGDAPHIVLAPNSVADCLFTTQWAVHLAETLQSPALVLSDQLLGQTQAVIDPPPTIDFATRRLLADADVVAARGARYERHANTPSGVSPMALPGMKGCQYTADGLEHNTAALPSSQADDHTQQLDKRLRKLTDHDYGAAWADVEGDGELALITWGSCTGVAREAVERLRSNHGRARMLSLRLLWPPRPEEMAKALAGVKRALVVEQSHGAQFLHYLRAHYVLPPEVASLRRPGPLPLRPAEITQRLLEEIA